MRALLVTLFLFISFLGFGQQINAPDPKEFTVNTSGQDASGFTLSGFNTTSTLLCAVGLPVAPSGTTFYFSTTSGVTASTGYSMSGNKTRISFTGTMANINTVLASLKINTTGTAGDISISVSATVNPTGYYYLPTNGHFYKPVSGFSGVTGFSGTSSTGYNNLKTYCTQQSFKGQAGYLMTITSSDEDNFVYLNVPGSNIIFALTDNVTEGTFKIDAGPEAGTTVRIGATNQQGKYNNWASGEPNNWGPGEDYVVTKWNGGTQWNDYGPEATAFPGGISGYVIEFGTWSNPDDQTFTDFYNNSVTHTNGPNLNLKAFFNFTFGGGIDETKFSGAIHKRNDATSNWTANTYKALNGLGRVTLSDQLDTAKVYSSAIQLATGTIDMQAFTTADIGKVYKLTTTGTTGYGWGTDIYTNDSYIPAMAVHAGVLAIGQTKEIYIKVVEGQNDYPSSTRNGITTSYWGAWGLSYQFVSQPSSYKANTSPGQVEWCVIYDYEAQNGRYRIGIDAREFTGTNVTPSNVSKLKLFDLWDGPVTYGSYDPNGWAEYYVYTNTQFNYAGSSYSANLRAGNGFYGVSAEFTFAQIGAYKQHKFVFQDYDSTQLKTLYNSIVTVSDVYLAFKEFSDAGGLFGGGSGTQFGYGIQFKNADVNDDGYFNEADCFALLQHLTGVKDLINSYTLDNTMKIILDTTYGTIGKSNWQQFPSYLGKEYGFSLIDGKINYTYNLATTWKGDVNLSHSATPPSNGITTNSANFGMTVKSMSTSTNQMSADFISELSVDSVYVEIVFNPGDNNIVGTQFQLNYDNSLLKYNKTEYIVNGSPTNYSANKGNYINVGSLNTDGSQITSATYKVLFTTTQKLNGVLGLVSMGNSEAVNKDGKSLAVKIK
jgi:hypothetical protein